MSASLTDADDREDRLLPWSRVRDITGLSRSTAWRLQRRGDFPAPVPLSPGRVGWWESELTAWKAARRTAGLDGARLAPPRAPKLIETARSRKPAAPKAAPAVAATEPLVGKSAPSASTRRSRRRVSPDQIDFGF